MPDIVKLSGDWGAVTAEERAFSSAKTRGNVLHFIAKTHAGVPRVDWSHSEKNCRILRARRFRSGKFRKAKGNGSGAGRSATVTLKPRKAGPSLWNTSSTVPPY
jgi:hypothetical protein